MVRFDEAYFSKKISCIKFDKAYFSKKIELYTRQLATARAVAQAVWPEKSPAEIAVWLARYCGGDSIKG